MKKKSYSVALMALLALGLVSCDKKESTTITIHELGYDNSKKVVAGNEFHIDAEILAPNKIASIQLLIHNDNEHNAMLMENFESSVWEFDSIYTKGYVGAKNTEFHEDLVVPITAKSGDYHVIIKVTDMDGNQTKKEDEIEVQAPSVLF